MSTDPALPSLLQTYFPADEASSEPSAPTPESGVTPTPAADVDPRQLILQLDPQELIERSVVVRLPLNHRFRGVTRRDVLLLEGPAGWAEWAPFTEYDDEIAGQWLLSTIDMAYNHRWYPSHQLPPVAVNATIPACQPQQVPQLLQRYHGCATVKIKVAEPGQDLADDLQRITAVRNQAPDADIRLDANGAWTVQQAVAAAQAFAATGPIDYLEQPCATRTELAQLRTALQQEGLQVPIAADESIRRAQDPYRVIREGACDVAVVKAPPLGGPRRVAEVAQAAHHAGLRVTISSALDSAVGMYAGLCAGLVADSAPAGLATGGLYEDDVVASQDRRRVQDGQLPAHYVAADREAIARCRADASTTQWWHDRLVRATRAAAASANEG